MSASARRPCARQALLAAVLALIAVITAPAAATGQPGPDPRRFEADIAAFEAADRASPPPAGAVLFVGSSSIRYWNVTEAFPGRSVIKRGFGGSHVSDNIYFADRVIVAYKPALIVFYAGDADVAGGKQADQIAADYRALVALIHAKLPAARTIVIGTKPSPAHWAQMDTIRAANAAVRRLAEADPLVEYVDVEAALLGPDGRPRADFYADNGLNLNERGYDAWNAAVRAVIERNWPTP
jgi:lysophospholipase L1-like esterase